MPVVDKGYYQLFRITTERILTLIVAVGASKHLAGYLRAGSHGRSRAHSFEHARYVRGGSDVVPATWKQRHDSSIPGHETR